MRRSFALLLMLGGLLGLNAAEERTGKEFEQHFLAKTPPHHQHPIEMAQLCQEKAEKADVKAFCAKLISSQQEEKKQMESWRQSWHQGAGQLPKAEMQKMEAQHKKHMAQLNAATGEKFDHTFLMAMTEHHRDGLSEIKGCQTRAAHSELKSLCVKMTQDQKKDIKEMQSMGGGAHQH